MSPRVELRRDAYTRYGTLGVWRLFYDDPAETIFSCLSAENQDRGNQPGVSCIPEGEYKLVRSVFHRGGYPCFQIFSADGSQIPGRTLVKVHRGNVADDVQGCVVLGFRPIAHKGQWGVGPSGGSNGGFTRWMLAMDELEIQECPLKIYFQKG